MDPRNELVNQILIGMQNIVDGSVLGRLQAVLLTEVNKYEIQVYVYTDSKSIKNAYDKYAA